MLASTFLVLLELLYVPLVSLLHLQLLLLLIALAQLPATLLESLKCATFHAMMNKNLNKLVKQQQTLEKATQLSVPR